MVYKCHCCGKVLKTEIGFKKHFCEYQKRFVEIESHNWMEKWLKMKTVFRIHVKKDRNKEYYDILHSSFYTQFVTFLQWCDKTQIINYTEYLEFLKRKKYPMKQWYNDNVYNEYIKDYLKNELPSLANERSEKYLKDNNITLDNISPNNLYFGLLSGNISNKYLKYKNVDVTKILDNGQLKDLKDLLV